MLPNKTSAYLGNWTFSLSFYLVSLSPDCWGGLFLFYISLLYLKFFNPGVLISV